MSDTQLFDGMTVFHAVAKAMSFTRAAELTGHTPSYISKEINKLEARLGVRLMNRTTRRINLTPEGKRYYELCSQVISDVEQVENILTGQQLIPKGQLKISSPIGFGISKLSPLLPKFTQQFPEVELDIDLSDRKVDILADNYDVVIRASSKLEDSGLISRKFLTSDALVLASPEYLKRHGQPKTPQELSMHQVITYKYVPNNQWFFASQDGNEIHVPIKHHIQTNSPELILRLAEQGLGIIRTPRFNINKELENGTLVEVLNDFNSMQIGVYLVYPSRKHLAAKVRCFIDFVVKNLGN